MRDEQRSDAQPDSEIACDVLVIGAGPTGMTFANAIARRGHHVVVVEHHKHLYGLPRAGHLDHEAVRILQGLGCHEEVLEDGMPREGNRWLDGDGEVMWEFPHWKSSTSSFRSIFFYQPILENVLEQRLGSMAHAEILRGWDAGIVAQTADSVTVEVRSEDSPAKHVRAKFVVAADGAGSRTRTWLGIDRDDYGFNERWCTVDVRPLRPHDFGPPAVVGDPRRPHAYGNLGKSHHRFEWQLLPGETTEDFSRAERAWQLLASKGITPDDVEIIRHTVFTFEYRVARNWRQGRVFLLGDSAHTMPPVLGQGMCSGMRDAVNLEWKMDLVLRDEAELELLDSYESERLPNVRAWGDMALTAGQIAFTTDVVAAAERDDKLRRGERPDFGPPPALGEGFASARTSAKLGRTVFPQRSIDIGTGPQLIDDVLGSGFSIVSVVPVADLPESARLLIQSLPANVVEILSDATDCDGFYRQYFAEHGIEIVVIRPDRYVYGAGDLGELPALLDEMDARFHPHNHHVPLRR